MRKSYLTGFTMALLLAIPVAYIAMTPAVVRAESTQRSVEGRVSNGQDHPVENAVVFLKNTRSLAIKSVNTAKDGKFHFMQLSSADDYEVWAELDGKKSNVKTISSFDTRKIFILALKFK